MLNALLETSIALTPVILLLLLFSPVLGRRYAARPRYLVWLILAVRLLLPVNVTGDYAVRLLTPPVVEAATPEPDSGATAEEGIYPQDGGALVDPDNYTITTILPMHVISGPSRLRPANVVAAGWALGAALFLLYHLAAYGYTVRTLRRWSMTPGESVERQLAAAKKEMGIRRDIGLYISPQADSPLLMGFVRPRIVLPERAFSDGELLAILRHELAHWQRRDLWYKLILLLATAVHWFNPLVHIMVRQADADMELACDSDTLAGADLARRREYGLAVLGVLAAKPRYRTPLSTGFSGSLRQTKRRFAEMVDTGSKKRGGIPLLAVTVVVAVCGSFVACGQPQTPTPLPEQMLEEQQLDTPYDDMAYSGSADESIAAGREPAVDAGESYYRSLRAAYDRDSDAFSRFEADTDAQLRDISAGADRTKRFDGTLHWPVGDELATVGVRYDDLTDDQALHIIGTEEDIYGAPLLSAGDGVVLYAAQAATAGQGLGAFVVVDHGAGVTTVYGHLSQVSVEKGQTVAAGDTLGAVGSTGYSAAPHLYFSVRKNFGEPAEPYRYLGMEGASMISVVMMDPTEQPAGFVWPTLSGEGTTFENHIGNGMDIAQPEGAPVYASAAGTVVTAEEGYTGYGKYVILDHGNGYQTLYAHNSKLNVAVGDEVKQGQIIAYVGRSGNAAAYHLHFEVRLDGMFVNPADYVGTEG